MTPGRHPTEAIAMLPRRRASTILVVDQCEEVYSLCDDVAERERFLDALVEQAETGSLVVAIRADHLVDVSAHRGFAGVVERGLHLISGMREDELRAAIVEPARLAGLESSRPWSRSSCGRCRATPERCRCSRTRCRRPGSGARAGP